ncbi:MAG: ATP-binding cassette domain-containing protein [Gemmataceae bacterium]
MIELAAVSVRQGAFALDGVSLAVPAGVYAVLLGPSGAGKTTLLEVLAGLRRPRAGRVLLRGADVTTLPPAARNVGYVPQDGAVFRTMTVRENLGFALAVRGTDPAARVAELAGWLGLGGLLDRRAVGLSGGEAQRVALGRALAYHPDVLLLDEPLSAVDEAARTGLLDVLDGLRLQRRVTVLHVTHARAEADRLADVVLELAGGRVTARAAENR